MPKQFLDKTVKVEFRDGSDMDGRVLQFTEFWVVIEGKIGFYLIPWKEISNLWVAKPKEKETQQ